MNRDIYDVTVHFGTIRTDEVRVLVGVPAENHTDALFKARAFYKKHMPDKSIRSLSSGIHVYNVDRFKE